MQARPYVAHHIAFVAGVGQGDVVNFALSSNGLDGLGIVRSKGRQIRLHTAQHPGSHTSACHPASCHVQH